MARLLLRTVIFAITVVAIAVCLLILTLWANDIRQDRKHTIVVKSLTPLFGGAATGICNGAKLTELQIGTNLRVRRIRYWKNCVTFDVTLPDGRAGHIVLGEGDIAVDPPLKSY